MRTGSYARVLHLVNLEIITRLLRPVHTPHDIVHQPLCDNGRRRPLLSVVARQITCIGMLMICKYSSEKAEYAVADIVMAAATFFVIFEDEE